MTRYLSRDCLHHRHTSCAHASRDPLTEPLMCACACHDAPPGAWRRAEPLAPGPWQEQTLFDQDDEGDWERTTFDDRADP